MIREDPELRAKILSGHMDDSVKRVWIHVKAFENGGATKQDKTAEAAVAEDTEKNKEGGIKGGGE